MSETTSSSRQRWEMMMYALVGGLSSIPLTVGYNWQTGIGNEYSISMVFVGGLVAGYLARRATVNVGTTSFAAGVIGGVPGVVWILPSLSGTAADFASAWSFPPATVVLSVLFGTVLLTMTGVVGLLGGALGGWLRANVVGQRTPLAET